MAIDERHGGRARRPASDVDSSAKRDAAGATPKSLHFAVDDIDRVHEFAEELGVLAPSQVHCEPASAVTTRPWDEPSFYVVDPWANDLCFRENTLYT